MILANPVPIRLFFPEKQSVKFVVLKKAVAEVSNLKVGLCVAVSEVSKDQS
jgi:hypothetical protein